ncbi:MAG: hypothetical protein WCC52_09780 [Nitrosotalea sp.]
MDVDFKKQYFFKTDHFRPFMDQNWSVILASFVENRGVKITPNASKNCIAWFFVTNALMKSMENAWEKQECLSVTVKFARNKTYAKMLEIPFVLFELLI